MLASCLFLQNASSAGSRAGTSSLPQLCPGALVDDRAPHREGPSIQSMQCLLKGLWNSKKIAVFAHLNDTMGMSYLIIHGLKKNNWYVQENHSEPLHSFESLNLQSIAFMFLGACQEIFLWSRFPLLRNHFEQRNASLLWAPLHQEHLGKPSGEQLKAWSLWALRWAPGLQVLLW